MTTEGVKFIEYFLDNSKVCSLCLSVSSAFLETSCLYLSFLAPGSSCRYRIWLKCDNHLSRFDQIIDWAFGDRSLIKCRWITKSNTKNYDNEDGSQKTCWGCLSMIGVFDTLSDSIQCLNFAKKWFIQYSIQYCFTQDSIQNIINLKK